MKSYTTLEQKEKVITDKEVSQEVKAEEEKKTIISNDAFAICDFIDQLINKAEHLRISSLMRR
jgi:DNA-binding transcriptional regulator YhcF (GntR family)